MFKLVSLTDLSWNSHRNRFDFPFMEFVEPTEDQKICNLVKD